MGRVINGNSDDIIEVTIRDYSGAKIESRICPVKDEQKLDRIIKWVKEKYGSQGSSTDSDWLSLDSEFLKL